MIYHSVALKRCRFLRKLITEERLFKLRLINIVTVDHLATASTGICNNGNFQTTVPSLQTIIISKGWLCPYHNIVHSYTPKGCQELIDGNLTSKLNYKSIIYITQYLESAFTLCLFSGNIGAFHRKPLNPVIFTISNITLLVSGCCSLSMNIQSHRNADTIVGRSAKGQSSKIRNGVNQWEKLTRTIGS